MDISFRMLRRLSLLFLFAILLSVTVDAHPTPYSYLDLKVGASQIDATLVAHLFDLAHDLNVSPIETLLDRSVLEAKRKEIEDIVRSRVLLSADGRRLDFQFSGFEPLPDRQAVAMHFTYSLAAAPGKLDLQCLVFPYDSLHQTFVNIYENSALTFQDILNKDRTGLEYFCGGRQGTLAVIAKFLPAGIRHIFGGPDHILFIVGLMLLGGTIGRLLTIVTAFTIAHSITLSLAALDIVNVPSYLVEPAIALSIVYVGVDNLMVGRTGRDFRALIAFFFGLVHGFGFAGVLREFGLPRQALGWSLFSFNVGVEIGQVVIVVIVASLLALIRRRNPTLGRRIVVVGSVLVAVAGAYWFFQRVFFQVT